MAALLILFIVVPIVELYVIIKIGGLIGVLPTIALLLVDGFLGALLLRQQGRDAWRRFNEALAERRFPGREVADGVMIAVGGTLLLTPGFVTDAFGLILLIPPSRAVIRRLMRAYVGRRFVLVDVGRRAAGYGRGAPSERPYDIDGTAEETPPDEQSPPRQLP